MRIKGCRASYHQLLYDLCCLSFLGLDDRAGKARLGLVQSGTILVLYIVIPWCHNNQQLSGEGDIPDGICHVQYVSTTQGWYTI